MKLAAAIASLWHGPLDRISLGYSLALPIASFDCSSIYMPLKRSDVPHLDIGLPSMGFLVLYQCLSS